MATETHRYVGNHPQELMVDGNSVTLEPGDFVTPNLDDVTTKDLLSSGNLVDLKSFESDPTPSIASLGGDK